MRTQSGAGRSDENRVARGTPQEYLEGVNLEAIVEELRTLPPGRLEQAADYIHRLHAGSRLERKAALRKAAGSLADEEADDLATNIAEGRENIDEAGW
jgi:hypothetical protein